jgi:hypothetical protein
MVARPRRIARCIAEGVQEKKDFFPLFLAPASQEVGTRKREAKLISRSCPWRTIQALISLLHSDGQLCTTVPTMALTRHSPTRDPELDCSRAALGGGLINKRPMTQIEFGAFCFAREIGSEIVSFRQD